ncbi:unnamed protein product [Closterium sp. Yama58-4]|nr:unnamed protein product [Closterium sp. Yama58-4]
MFTPAEATSALHPLEPRHDGGCAAMADLHRQFASLGFDDAEGDDRHHDHDRDSEALHSEPHGTTPVAARSSAAADDGGVEGPPATSASAATPSCSVVASPSPNVESVGPDTIPARASPRQLLSPPSGNNTIGSSSQLSASPQSTAPLSPAPSIVTVRLPARHHTTRPSLARRCAASRPSASKLVDITLLREIISFVSERASRNAAREASRNPQGVANAREHGLSYTEADTDGIHLSDEDVEELNGMLKGRGVDVGAMQLEAIVDKYGRTVLHVAARDGKVIVSSLFAMLPVAALCYYSLLLCPKESPVQTSIWMRSRGDDAIQADACLLEYLSKFTELTSLKVCDCDFDDECEFFLGLGFACPALTHLDLRSQQEDAVTRDDLDALFTACTGLEHLSLAFDASPADLPPSFFRLSFLKELYLKALPCDIPDEIGKLTCLKKLTFDDLPFSELPDSFGILTGLTELQILRCNGFEHLPESFGGLSSLVKLIISSAEQLEDIPDSIGRLQNLQECVLKRNPFLSALPDSFFLLTSLRVLELTEFEELQHLPSAISNLVSLESLTIKMCIKLRELPESMDCFSSLQHLELWQLSSLTRLPDSISSLSKLQTFSFNHCNSVTRVPRILLRNWRSSLTTLEFGWPTSCPAGNAADATHFVDGFKWSLCRLESLSTLSLFGIPRLTSCAFEVIKFKRLQRLTMCSCPDLRSLRCIYRHTAGERKDWRRRVNVGRRSSFTGDVVRLDGHVYNRALRVRACGAWNGS